MSLQKITPDEGRRRRRFLIGAGVTAGAGALARHLPLTVMQPATAAETAPAAKVETKHTVCTHCSVGCSVEAVVSNGVWIRQEPAFDSPLNMGAHCAKGASVREHGFGEHRLRYPMKLVNGKYERISWDQAINEIGDRLLALRKQSGPDALMVIGSSKHNNEQAYLLRKWVSMWGSNNVDHQARICHSTTVAGVAQTFGYGAMTNSFNDLHHSKAVLFIGSNPAEAHPISMLHFLHAKELGAKMIVIDPRFTRTARFAHHYVRVRPGTDIALVWGILWHIFANGWEDKKFIADRTYGMEEVRKEVAKWTPEKVSDVTGVPEAAVRTTAEMLALNRPSSVVWCMGITQHHVGTANVRALSILQLALGNIGVPGGGANIYRGHDNVQGATDVGPNADSLPGYYGLAEGAWKHFATAWGVDYSWLLSRYGSKELMEKPGITVSRWFDAVNEEAQYMDQPTNLKAVFYWGHAPNSQTRLPDMKAAMQKLDMLVVIDPYPSLTAAMHGRQEGVYLLPAASQFETQGSVTASNRSIQWREKVIEPLFECKTDHEIMYLFARKLGFHEQLCKNIKVVMNEPVVEDILREINRSCWTIGYTGCSPERLKLHMENKHTFDPTTLRAESGPCKGDYYGLPWPCWGTPEMKHPGTPILYDLSKTIAEGGLPFRANWGVDKDGVSLLAADGSTNRDSELDTGYPEFDHVFLKKLGWWSELTPAEQAQAEGKNWKTDNSGGIIRVAIAHGCAPFGNARARCHVWNFPDPVPVHREPLLSPRRDLVAKYPTYDDKANFWRLPTLYKSVQAVDFSKDYPLVMTSGRLVEYEGGGEETRSNPWLAELQQHMFCEVNPQDAAQIGATLGEYIWIETPTGARLKMMAMVTPRVPAGIVWMPFHFGGWWMGEDLEKHYPEGGAPEVRGESVNTAWTYGYDAVTMMQETKVSLCRLARA
ncbi:formate dehydrogenase subunit alpha [Pseudoduganella buxea]|uniref:Formate dehydrogenase n=1 Tax=Pseudoduganella buxea TaxID=1949069 RepID=A0A6I3T5K1_9BURK|nr:formate dehydrogenase subunit alpha [Pseudoduganella buxea]MTV56195.1 molybdopterin-dependent oxidoreductase [Pseudoduganella buxea]GGC02023.1 formate dehydrogenase [Pseudoduganella buxea]